MLPGLLSRPVITVAAVLVFGIGCYAMGYMKGRASVRVEALKQQLAQVELALAESGRVIASLRAAERDLQGRKEAILMRVPVVVTNNAACALNADAVALDNLAWSRPTP